LRNGVTIESLKLLGYKAERLYLKLDKKIILKLSYLGEANNTTDLPKKPIKSNIERNQTRGIKLSKLSNVAVVKNYLNQLLTTTEMFEYVSLKNVNFKGKNYLLSFSNDRVFHFNSNRFEFAGEVLKNMDSFVIEYPFFYFKKFHLFSNGKVNYSLKDGDIKLNGNYLFVDINGSYSITFDQQNEMVEFELNSDNTATFKQIFDLFKMGKVLREWLYNRIQARNYKLLYLKGKARLVNGKPKPILDSVEAKVLFEDLNVTFHSKLPAIRAKSATAVLKKKSIFFEFEEPKYRGRDINGSSVSLVDIHKKEKIALNLHIKYRGSLDEKLIEILNQYGINSQVRQVGGYSVGTLDMFIPFQKDKNSTFISKISLKGGKVNFGSDGGSYPIIGGEMEIRGSEIALKKFWIKPDNLVARVDGTIDTKVKKADLNLFVKSFFLPLGESYIKIKNRKLPLKIYWERQKKLFNLPTLKTDIELKKSKIRIKIREISLLKDYIGGVLTLLDGGSVEIKSKDMKNYSISGDIYSHNLPLTKKNRQISRWEVDLKASKSGLFLATSNRNIVYSSKKNLLIIKNLDIDNNRLQRLLKKIKKIEAKSGKILSKRGKSSRSRAKSKKRLTVIGKNSSIKYPPYRLYCREFTLKVGKYQKDFLCKVGKYRLKFLLDDAGLKRVSSRAIDSKTLYKITNFNEVKGARYSFDVKRDRKGNYRGKIFFKHGLIDRLKNQTGFGKNGFEVDKGKIFFVLPKRGDRLRLTTLLLEGKVTTIAGDGTINLKTDALDLDLVIHTAKDIGGTLGNVPIIGYILFGEDKSLTVGVKVKGTLSKPEVSTNSVASTLSYPLKLLNRTLISPIRLLQGNKNMNKRPKKRGKKEQKPPSASDILRSR
jgi:hypothetical protein